MPKARRRTPPGQERAKSRPALAGEPWADLEELARLTWGTATEGLQVRRVHPVQARKVYRCPGCQQEIPVGTGHVVVVPLEDPASRRHWHTSCWVMRDRRPPGR